MAGILGSFGGAFGSFGIRTPTSPLVTIPITDLANFKTIGGGKTTHTGGQYNMVGRGGAQYQVTAGKTFVAPGFFAISGATTGDFVEFGYADTALAAHGTATVPTNPVSLWSPTGTLTESYRLENGTIDQSFWVAIPLIVPASKYIYYRINSTTSFHFMIPFREV